MNARTEAPAQPPAMPYGLLRELRLHDERPDTVLTRWALTAHQAHCRSCGPNGLENCPVGEHLHAAARPDRTWIPDHPAGA